MHPFVHTNSNTSAPLGVPCTMLSQLEALIENKLPLVSTTINTCVRAVTFRDSPSYWEQRYARGGNSGAGSYGCLADFKARILNDFVREQGIETVVEFGCGDGHQLSLAEYPTYIGVDVSASAVALCRQRFAQDSHKRFLLRDATARIDEAVVAELALSLDVIYHLVEEHVFQCYMSQLFDAARRYVIIYSSNVDSLPPMPHVRHRNFTTWIEEHRPDWTLVERIANQFPFDPRQPNASSLADFFVFARQGSLPRS